MGRITLKHGAAAATALMLILVAGGSAAASAAGPHAASSGGAGLGQTKTETTVTFTSPGSRSPLPTRTTTRPTSTEPTPVTTAPVGATEPAAPSRGLDKLRNALKLELRHAGGSDSALVVDDTTGTTLFSEKPKVQRLPASVEKLYTTATALFTLGADARLSTSVLGNADVGADGTYHGALYLKGGGDPTFGDQDFDARLYGKNVGATVQQLVTALKAAGIRRVDGPIVADESYFDARRGGPDTHYRANLETEGELSGLAYDDGFTSSAEIALQPQPALWAGQALASAMRAAGITVPKHAVVKLGVTPPGATALATVQSPPLSTLIELTNSPSDDFFAETLLKDLGEHASGVGSTATGATVVRKVMAEKLGVEPTVVDGSGLSRRDRTTADEVIKLLEEMRDDPAFYDSLAIAGVRGTMDEEMLHSPAVNNCRGKTGTLHDVANLVGYCTAANGDQLTFAFLLNGQRNSTVGHELEDVMGVDLADYRP